MFELIADYFWVVLFAALVLYGLWQTVSAPFFVKRFYQNMNFRDNGKSRFDSHPYDSVVILQGLKASHVYSGTYKDYRVEQFAAFPETRHKFTMSRVQRKRNQAIWTVTLLHCEKPIMPFCARPTTVTDAMSYVLEGGNIDFEEDEGLTKRVHVLADDHEKCKALLTPKVRDYLKHIDAISLESAGSLLVHKSPGQPHDVGQKLQGDLDALVGIYEELVQPW